MAVTEWKNMLQYVCKLVFGRMKGSGQDCREETFRCIGRMTKPSIGGILLTLILLMWRIGRAPNSIPIYSYIQEDATLHSLLISGKCSTCFGWYFHPSSGAHATVSTAFGICQTVTAICCYQLELV
jgi:hypothetical protein